MLCKDCGQPIHVWADGLHHDERWLDGEVNDRDERHPPRLDDGEPNDTLDLFRRPRR